MNVGEAAAVTAAITKDFDLFNDVGIDPSRIRAATDKLRDKVREYAKALGPLKDVFGSDIPAMIAALENLSGQRLSQLNPQRMGAMVERVMVGATVGGYNLGQVVNMRSKIGSAIGQMNVPYINEMGALAQAATVLDATVTGFAPATMTQERYQNSVGEWVMRTSNSSGAEYLNLAYATWKQNNPEGTFEDFKAQYNTLRSEFGADKAILEIAGASDFYNLKNQGYQSRYFTDAVREDIGGRLAREENLNELIGRGYVQAYGSQREAYSAAVKAVQHDMKLMTDDTYLAAHTGEGMAEDGMPKVSAAIAGQIQAIKQGYYGAELVTALHADAELRRKQPIIEKQMALKRNIEELRITFPDNLKTAIDDFIGGKGLYESLTSSLRLQYSDVDTQEMLKDVAEVTQAEMAFQGIDETENPEKAKEFATNFLTYAMSNGYTNEFFTENLIRYSDNKKVIETLSKKETLTEEEKKTLTEATKARDIARSSMYMSQYVDDVRLSNFVGTSEERRSETVEVFRNALNKKMTATEAGQEVMDYITATNLTDTMEERSVFKGPYRDIGEEFKKRLIEKSEEKGAMNRTEVIDIIDVLQKEQRFSGRSEEAFELLKNITNSAFNRESNSGTEIKDVLNLITEAISKMGGLSDMIKQLIPILEHKPENS
jgi:hypothetical protein